MKHLAPLCLLIASACTTAHHAPAAHYQPEDAALYATVSRLDSAFFAAYNTCDVNLATWGSFFADSVEFYHDAGGVMTSKQGIIDATRRNVCGKVTRELMAGSLEVYPISHYAPSSWASTASATTRSPWARPPVSAGSSLSGATATRNGKLPA